MVESLRKEQKLLFGGLRTRVVSEKKFSVPIITVITVVCNGEEIIRRTIESVVNQTYEGIEYIIIDGGSSDRTLAIIKEYEDRIDYWLSEPDKGIYDAMNKAAYLAKGELINFMNAGDVFYKSTTVESLLCYFNKDYSLIYGDAQRVSNGFIRKQRAKPFSHLWKGLVASHQSIFIKSQVLKDFCFNTGYSLAADYELLCRLYLRGDSVKKVSLIISVVPTGGESDTKRIKALQEMRQISVSTFKNNIISIYFDFMMLAERIKAVLKKYLPHRIACIFIKYKYFILNKFKGY